MTYILHQSPQAYQIARSRWRLQDLKQAVEWMRCQSEAAISRTLKRLGLSHKQVLRFVHSPDPDYESKCEAIQQAYAQAQARPDQVVLLFGDELTYYRSPTPAPVYAEQGPRQPRIYQHAGPNTQTRLLGALNALTGQLLYLQRSTVGIKALVDFAPQLRQAYPTQETLYLVLDN